MATSKALTAALFATVLCFQHCSVTLGADNTANVDYETWKAPDEIIKNFVYYLSGFDEDNRPIWIGEVGKWDARKYIIKGGQALQDLETYIDQALYRYNKSLSLRSTPENPVVDGCVLLDMEGYDLTQLTHAQTVQLLFRKAHDVDIVAKRMAKGFFVNANYIGERLINILKPVLGPSLQRTDIYGTNKDVWIPKVLRKLPRESLPEWYGGDKNFKPVAVYG